MQKTILFLAANPKETSPLNLKKEVEAVQQELARLECRHAKFIFKQQWATTKEGVRHALLDHKPHFVHFLGHDPNQASIMLENEEGEARIVRGEMLADFLKLSAHIECVILNACFNALQASQIVRHIHFVIGMNQPIGDKAAIQFSKGFYDALAAGESIPIAFELGRTAIQTDEEHLKPVLKQRFVDNFWLMPFRENHFFTGREEILHQLQDCFTFPTSRRFNRWRFIKCHRMKGFIFYCVAHWINRVIKRGRCGIPISFLIKGMWANWLIGCGRCCLR
jgi:hypothetical protein